jgi:hypothetical protein
VLEAGDIVDEAQFDGPDGAAENSATDDGPAGDNGATGADDPDGRRRGKG